ncbi:conserved hypothetical protein [Methanococcus vannielii SB]|uniref:DUF2119 domain-containing protein n=1 Tax=Methanococcus vannielii (strain ATCC 35089 / DSM 1224 / JCM 13029 / OCM 148 / SB) TaxID=406327 RepID=A6UPV3_METVS|nr:DUF2119 domain-containing protein [Methanococcus vannielii]ABR54525.1 conserved hypothetical protein [Methanococcus vannielii SB]
MKIYSNSRESFPKKLFLAGIHGNESKYTSKILELLKNRLNLPDIFGNIVIIPEITKNSKYVSTLDEKYYKTNAGKILLGLIEEYRPEFYFEIHSYSKNSYFKLTELNRVNISGIPPFVDLNNGVLMASIPPALRKKFKETDFCMTLEVPNWKSHEVYDIVLEILEFGVNSINRDEMIEKIFKKYPKGAKKAKWLAEEFNLTFL